DCVVQGGRRTPPRRAAQECECGSRGRRGMRLTGRLILVAVLAATIWPPHDGARAALTGACTGPDYLLSSDYRLRRVTAAAEKQKSLRIAVIGTGSSALAGPEGPRSAHPARLATAFGGRLSDARG